MARFLPLMQYFDNSGDPLISGLLYFFESGTTTPKVTYADVNLSIPNAHPVEITPAGRQPNIFFNGAAKVVLTDDDDVVIATQDPVGQTDVDMQLQPWSSTFRYQDGSLVEYSGGYYVSLVNNNVGNIPTSLAPNWATWPFPSFAKGSLTAGTGTTVGSLAVGTDGQVLLADSTQPLGLRYADAGFIAATQAQMETATSNITSVTPLNANWHPGVNKVWLNASGDGLTINASWNVTSITDGGTGQLVVTVATDFSSANPSILCGICAPTPLVYQCPSTVAAGSFQILCRDLVTTSFTDPSFYFAAGLGDQ